MNNSALIIHQSQLPVSTLRKFESGIRFADRFLENF